MLRVAPAVIWVLLLGLAVFVAPPSENTWALVVQLAMFQGPDPLLVAIFQLMGVWPFWYGRKLWRDHGLIALLALASFAVGAFALMPALALRDPDRPLRTSPAWLVGLCRSLAVRAVLIAVTVGLAAYGLLFGDWGEALRIGLNDGFVFTYCLDFLALTLMYPVLLAQERRRELPGSPGGPFSPIPS